MPIPDDACKELEEALGSENVSQDPGLIETYTFMNGLGSAMTGNWVVRPVGVVLPGSTEEVQKVIEICNRYRLRFKAHSTAWSFFALAMSKNCVLMDLRRMSELEIHEEDGFLITEPYATAGETQVETMKRGYIPHLVGAGPNASNLASATSMQGTGGGSVRTSMNERNVLAVEWVLPNGDILRLGSADSPRAGWFCGDGPGPGLRGMMRGSIGNIGGNGVFTRVALKLYPWYGQAYECGGGPPFFESRDMPLSYLRYVSWPSMEKECDALYALSETEILDYSNRWSAASLKSAVATSNEQYLQMKKEKAFEKEFPQGYWTFFFKAHSQRQFDYSVKAFEKIVSDTEGQSLDPRELGREAYEIALQNAVRAIWIGKSAYMPTSSNSGAPPLAYETIDHCLKHALKETVSTKKEWVKAGRIYDDGEDNTYACLDENGHYLHVEHACHADSWEKKTEATGIVLKGLRNSLAKNLSPTYMSVPSSWADLLSYASYMLKIQQLIDPKGSADTMLGNAFKNLVSK